MRIQIDVPVAELFDRISILKIKQRMIKDPSRLANVNEELNTLVQIQARFQSMPELDVLVQELFDVNKALWDVEDALRRHEHDQTFDGEFVRLARSVYITNDRRAALKRNINELLGSDLIEIKEYVLY